MNIGRAVMSMVLLYFIYHFIDSSFSNRGYSPIETIFFSIIVISSIALLIKAPLEGLIMGTIAYVLLISASIPALNNPDTFLYIYITSLSIALIISIISVINTYKLEVANLHTIEKRKRKAKLWMDIGRGTHWFYYLIILLFNITLITNYNKTPSAPGLVFSIGISIIILVFCLLLYFKPFIGYILSTILLLIMLVSVIITTNNDYTSYTFTFILFLVSLILIVAGMVNTFKYHRINS